MGSEVSSLVTDSIESYSLCTFHHNITRCAVHVWFFGLCFVQEGGISPSHPLTQLATLCCFGKKKKRKVLAKV